MSLAEADIASQRRFSPADRLAGQASGHPQTWSKEKPNKPRPVKTIASARPEPASHWNKITQSVLTEQQVREIKAKPAAPDGRTKMVRRAEIAASYGISAAAVKEIDLGYSWRHIECGVVSREIKGALAMKADAPFHTPSPPLIPAPDLADELPW